MPNFDRRGEARYARTFIQTRLQDAAAAEHDPSYRYHSLETPRVLVEDDGTIIAWYLPGLLSNVNQVNWRLSTHKSEFMTSLGTNLEQFAILETNFAVQPHHIT